MTQQDMYAGSSETSQGKVFTVTGQDWDSISEELGEEAEERVVVNMGPQHPSTHGVLRLILELEGETVKEARCGIGYLHTGIEKNMEYRTWVQGTTFCTRMDYLSPFYNEASYAFGVERLLDIEDEIPEKAQVLRVLLMELNRISSHLVCIATGGMEIGALTVMTIGFRERELVLDLFELITGLRMNHAYIRPGGVAQDLPPGALDEIRDFVALMKKRLAEYAALCNANPIFKARLEGVGHLDLAGCLALGLSGPVLRSTGYPWDLRKTQPYCGYEDYDFDVQTWDTCDSYGRFRVRLAEMGESLKIVEQAADRLAALEDAPVMVGDKKIAWPSQLAIGSDGMGNSLDHIRHIMGESMEALIHHFKLVTEGFRVPAGQAYVPVESPRGELGAHVVSDGGTRPFRAHFRDPSFTNLQATSVMSEGGMVADVIVAIVQAQAGRRLPRRRLHQHPVRGDGRRCDLRAAQGSPRRRQRRDHRGRQDHPRARRVQCRLRLRPGDDGQLGVHGQHDPTVRDPAGRRPARGQGGPLDPGPAAVHLARGRARARRLPRRPRRRGPGGRARQPGRAGDRP
jgi:NADH-quinone oxidoreductase subunit D